MKIRIPRIERLIDLAFTYLLEALDYSKSEPYLLMAIDRFGKATAYAEILESIYGICLLNEITWQEATDAIHDAIHSYMDDCPD